MYKKCTETGIYVKCLVIQLDASFHSLAVLHWKNHIKAATITKIDIRIPVLTVKINACRKYIQKTECVCKTCNE